MSDVFAKKVISGYSKELEKELYIRGVPAEKSKAVLNETEAHLCEMFEETKLANPETYGQLLKQFGAAKKLAKGIAAEIERSRASRPFLWPSAISLVALLVVSERWAGLWSLLFLYLLLIAAGFISRKPTIGQFAALGLVTTALLGPWIGLFNFPVGQYSNSGSPVPYKQYVSGKELPKFLNDVMTQISEETLIIDETTQGTDYFKKILGEGRLPSFIQFQGSYLTPSGVKTVHESGSDSLLPGQLKPSLTDVMDVWNNGRSARLVKLDEQQKISRRRDMLASIELIKSQPVTRLRIGLVLALPMSLELSGLALCLTNLGFLLWALLRDLKRLWRRIKYWLRPLSA
ncbi:MAG TPA: hypothetical protein VGL56_16640 [Fimbriimonadaceae bacterium]|jgi:hypothetical protein